MYKSPSLCKEAIIVHKKRVTNSKYPTNSKITVATSHVFSQGDACKSRN